MKCHAGVLWIECKVATGATVEMFDPRFTRRKDAVAWVEPAD